MKSSFAFRPAHTLRETGQGALRLMLQAVFPPACPSCRQPVEAMHSFCADCFKALRMIANPMCDCCGIPFVVALEANGHCPECLLEKPSFTRARAPMVYDARSMPLVTSLKFHDQWSSLPQAVRLMASAARTILEEAELIVPVPLHWRRLWWRKYNQSALLAYGLAREAGVPCLPSVLVRARSTRPQMRLDRSERKRNVKGAFEVAPAWLHAVKGKRILLVDDVVTTGATVEICARTLLDAGAAQVDVVALARTVKE
jgi:ComF family protein